MKLTLIASLLVVVVAANCVQVFPGPQQLWGQILQQAANINSTAAKFGIRIAQGVLRGNINAANQTLAYMVRRVNRGLDFAETIAKRLPVLSIALEPITGAKEAVEGFEKSVQQTLEKIGTSSADDLSEANEKIQIAIQRLLIRVADLFGLSRPEFPAQVTLSEGPVLPSPKESVVAASAGELTVGSAAPRKAQLGL